jgi:hypothetical protein
VNDKKTQKMRGFNQRLRGRKYRKIQIEEGDILRSLEGEYEGNCFLGRCIV